ncbi:MAG: DNA polymerase I [Oscillospiraceae bacterium]
MKLLAIDGNSILNRAFYGVRPLTTKDGTYTNAIFGFLNMLMKLEKDTTPDAVAIAFDVSRKTFRNDQYADYKANRKGMPDELRMQLPLVKEILLYMGYKIATAEGFEGDDVLGTLAQSCCNSGHSCVVATGDRDCLQLVTDCVTVSLAKTAGNIIYTREKVLEDYGMEPLQIIDLKALMGDASDNIPGVKGVGEKTALTLIQNNHNIEKIYEDIEAIEATPRVKRLLFESKDMAFLSKKLATICLEVPIDTEITDYVRGETDEQKLSEILTRLEMYSFFDKLNVKMSAGSAVAQESVPTIKISCEVVTADQAHAVGFLGTPIVSLIMKDDSLLLNVGDTIYNVTADRRDEMLKHLFKNKIPINTFMAKPIYKLAKDWGYEDIVINFDAELAAYLLNPSSKGYDFKTLTNRHLNSLQFDVSEEFLDIAALPYLCDTLNEELITEEMKSLYDTIEMPLCEVLADMEHEGFEIDKAGIEKFGKQLENDIELTKEQVFKLVGEEFNINSTKELGVILFEKLGLPSGKKTKTGYSTNVDVLESLMDKHEVVPQIMEYRKLAKLYSTYVVGLLKVISPDGRVHSTFNQTETRTGRISSTEPNVQNIPIRTKLGSEIRKFFVAREGYTLIDADYSQIELRILAHISADTNMIKAFKDKADIHAITASQVFNHPIETLPSELRSRAKAINFGIVYGISAYSLSQDINVSMHEAKEYIEAYLHNYAGVAEYMQNVVEQARIDGFVKTIYGRKRDLADINATNKMIKAFAERVALNTPVQGTAADIIKLAMIKVYQRIKKEDLDARLILQVHDELIVEAPVMQADRVKTILKEEMENAAKLSVPLVADISIGKDWYSAKG